MLRQPRVSTRAAAVATLAFASCLAPAAPTSAASGQFSVQFPPISGAGGGHGGEIEILSWSWGDSSAAQHRSGGSNQMSMDDTAGKEKSSSGFGEWIADVERPAPGAGKAKAAPTAVSHDLRTNVVARTATGGDPDRPIVAGSVPNPPAARGTNESILIGSGRTETASGQPTGKRQHMPIRTNPIYDRPSGKGSVWIRVSSPWVACRVGARYPSLRLAGEAQAYDLEDVTVARCGSGAGAASEEVAFTYKKVTVRGWDPKKKEE